MKLDHQMLTCKIIRANLDILQEHKAEEDDGDDEDSHSNSAAAFKPGAAYSHRTLSFGRLYLGSSNTATALQVFELDRAADPAYNQFRTRFAQFLKTTFPEEFAANWRLNPIDKVRRWNSFERLTSKH